MINSELLLQTIKYNHFSSAEIASILNITAEEFRRKLERGQLLSNEIEMLLHFLKFPCDPMKIFFTSYDVENPKKIQWEKFIRKSQRGSDAQAYLIHRP